MIPTEEEIQEAEDNGPWASKALDSAMLAAAVRIVERDTGLRSAALVGLLGIDKNAYYRVRQSRASSVAITQAYLWQRLAEIRSQFDFRNE